MSEFRVTAISKLHAEFSVPGDKSMSHRAAILGEPYPWVRPALPSDAKLKRKPVTPRATSASPASPAAVARESLRRLEGLETAYRVTYRRFGQVVTEDHDDLDALRTLLAAQGANLSVTRVETIDLGGRTKSVLLATSP